MRRSALWFGTCAVALCGVPVFFAWIATPAAFVYAQSPDEASTSPVGIADVVNEVSTSTPEEHLGNPNASTKFSITPVVSNEKAKPRDIIKKELLVTNNKNERVNVYISVENIDPTAGAQEFKSPGVSDLATSLANWIEITRGVIDLSPGESRKIPYLIHVNLAAKPGSYFARIVFTEGPRRVDAEAKPPEDGTSLMLNVEVLDDAKERLQLGNFTADDSVVTGENVSFSYLLENVGNRQLEPRGTIRIFNRKGEEVGSIPLNAGGEEITPDNKKQLAAVWNAEGRFGKYKAFLDLEYGENQLASVQDTVYFWVFPWKEVMLALMGVGLLAVIGTFIIHMRAIARPAMRRAPSMAQASSVYSPTPAPVSAYASAGHSLSAALPTQSSNRPGQVQQGGAVVLASRSRGVSHTAEAVVHHVAVAAPAQPRSTAPVVQGDTISLARRR
jgi:hypothetical protein